MASSKMSEADLDNLATMTLDELLDSATMAVIFDMHRSYHLGFLRCEDGDNPNYPGPPPLDPMFMQVEASTSTTRRGETPDVLGNTSRSITVPYVSCPSCSREIFATRFTAHLSNCKVFLKGKEEAKKKHNLCKVSKKEKEEAKKKRN